jgi:hypothetical protein
VCQGFGDLEVFTLCQNAQFKAQKMRKMAKLGSSTVGVVSRLLAILQAAINTKS